MITGWAAYIRCTTFYSEFMTSIQ